MNRLLPFGGVRSRHLTSRFEKKNFQNLIGLFVGWCAGLSPPILMAIIPYSPSFLLDFFILYSLISLVVLHVISFYLVNRNMNLFMRSPFMVPVVITSSQLRGLHNSFRDVSPDEFADISVATLLPDLVLPEVIQYMALFDEGYVMLSQMQYINVHFLNLCYGPQLTGHITFTPLQVHVLFFI